MKILYPGVGILSSLPVSRHNDNKTLLIHLIVNSLIEI